MTFYFPPHNISSSELHRLFVHASQTVNPQVELQSVTMFPVNNKAYRSLAVVVPRYWLLSSYPDIGSSFGLLFFFSEALKLPFNCFLSGPLTIIINSPP